jgi:hypothetical protein
MSDRATRPITSDRGGGARNDDRHVGKGAAFPPGGLDAVNEQTAVEMTYHKPIVVVFVERRRQDDEHSLSVR